MISLFYSTALLCFFFYRLPGELYDCIIKKKTTWKYWLQRFGKIHLTQLRDPSKKLLWIHGVSVGEIKVAASLLPWWQKRVPNLQIIVSAITPTGIKTAEQAIPQAIAHIPLPLDFRCIIAPLVRRLSPDWLILSETDFWYHFQRALVRQKTALFLINGKLSDQSCSRFARLPFFGRKLFSPLSLCCVQNQEHFNRFSAVGIPRKKLIITGNIKLAQHYPSFSDREIEEGKERFCLRKSDLILTIGSTHDPEEKELITVLKRVWKSFPMLRVFLVPRHPERFSIVAHLLQQESIPFSRFSQCDSGEKEAKVILIDTMGKLLFCYRLSTLAIVGGSYTPRVGGHNFIEPIAYEVPVIYGPHTHSQTELHSLIQRYDAGCQVPLEQLSETLSHLLSSETARKELRERGRKLMQNTQHTLRRTVDSIEPLLAC